MCWRSPSRADGSGPLEPLAAFMANPAGSAIVNAIGPIPAGEELQDDAGAGARRYLVIAPSENGNPGAPCRYRRCSRARGGSEQGVCGADDANGTTFA